MVKNCPNKSKSRQQQRTDAIVHNMHATIEGPLYIQQGRLEAPPPSTNSMVFTFTKEEVVGTSNVVTGQTLVTSKIA